jgi:hypothetical protein
MDGWMDGWRNKELVIHIHTQWNYLAFKMKISIWDNINESRGHFK